MDGMTFIGRDWRQNSSQERAGDRLRYAVATWVVFVLVLAVTLTTVAVLDQAGIHLPVGDEGFHVSGVAG
jgi:hypothetical protein